MADMTALQNSLLKAKMVMDKTNNGEVNSNTLPNTQTRPSSLSEVRNMPTPPLPSTSLSSAKQDLTPKSKITEERILSSKLPDAIKQAMITNPIPDAPFNNSVGLTDDFVSNVKEQMDRQGISTNSTTIPQPPTQKPNRTTTKKLSSKNLKTIIKESVKELVEEAVKDKLHGIKQFSTDKKENFKFIVGNKVFYGKITASEDLK